MTDEAEYAELRKEAAATFDLKDKYAKIGRRKGHVTLFVDVKAGDRLGSARDVKNNIGMVVDRVQEGVLGEIDRLDPESKTYDADLAKLLKEKDELIATLESTAMTFYLGAVPPMIAEGSKRRAKESLKIKGKVPEHQIEEFNDAYLAHLLSDTIESIVDHESGGRVGKQSYEDCVFHKQNLPPDQFDRLDKKLAEIQFKQTVDESISSDMDF